MEWRLIPEKVSVRGRVNPEEMARLLDEGLPYREIARRLGVDKSTVARWAKKLGKSRYKRSMTRVAVGLLKRGLSVAEVRRMVGLSKVHVASLKKRLNQYEDIPPLSDEEYMKLRTRISYVSSEERIYNLAPSLAPLNVDVDKVVEEALRIHRPGYRARTTLAVAALRVYPELSQREVCERLGVSDVAVRLMFKQVYGENLQTYRRRMKRRMGEVYRVVETPLGKLLLTPKEEMELRMILARAFARGGGSCGG